VRRGRALRASTCARGWPPRPPAAAPDRALSAKHPRAPGRALRASACARGFTLLELTIALLLLALMSSILFGSLSFAGRSWDGGEAKATQVDEMRQSEEFLRAQIGALYPLRARKVVEFPLLFKGERDEIRYAAALPSRVAEGGVYYFRLAVVSEGDKSLLVQERVIPDPDSQDEPNFRDGARSVLAEGIKELKIGYFGRDAGNLDADPTWRDKWDDKQRLPLLVRIDVAPEKGPAWPQLVIEPRQAPEAGCRAWDAARERCAGV
jgi:general secretion pathway protein J